MAINLFLLQNTVKQVSKEKMLATVLLPFMSAE
jgi:hypothetical protein